MIRYVVTPVMLMIFASAFSMQASGATELPLLKNAHRILFLGDSITYAGEYVDIIQCFLATHCREHDYEIIDAGLPSETVSGLTEPGHAGGAFPRPVLSERLDRVLHQIKPDLVFACYGMNDGIYYPFDKERFSKYKDGIQNLVGKVQAAGARIILITPPPFDAVPLKGHTLPAGLNAYPQPYEGYDDVLTKYSDWLLGQRKDGWKVIDIHTPINRSLADHRNNDPSYSLSSDGVHLNSNGHLLIASEILDYLGATEARTTVIDVATRRVFGASQGAVESKLGVTRVYLEAPCPEPVKFGIMISVLMVKNWKSPGCSVTIGDVDRGVFSRSELSKGVYMPLAYSRADKERSNSVLDHVHTMRTTLSDAWLTNTGHKRPGMAKGLPLDQALEAAQTEAGEIKLLAKPVLVDIYLRPASFSSKGPL